MKIYSICLIIALSPITFNFNTNTTDLMEIFNIQSSADKLEDAIRYFDNEEVEELLQENPELSLKEDEYTGSTPLHIALDRDNSEAASLLLDSMMRTEEKLNLEATNYSGFTPLILAIDAGNEKVVKQLLDMGANPNNAIYGDITPLHRTIISNKPEIAKILIKYGADPNIKNKKGQTPFEMDTNKAAQEEVQKFYETFQETMKFQLPDAFDQPLKNN